MYKEGNHNHYTEEEVRGIFKQQLESGNWQINKAEFGNFCSLLSCLNTEFVDLLHNEIHIVICSLERDERMENKKMPCACINLRDGEFLKAKKAVMVLSPYLLTLTFACNKLKKIFHEIAHFKRNHPMTDIDETTHKKNEQEAEDLALKWLEEEIHHLNGITSPRI